MHWKRPLSLALAVAAMVAAGSAAPTNAASEPPDPDFVDLAADLATAEKSPRDIGAATGGLSQRSVAADDLAVDEREPADAAGRNDEIVRAQRIRGLGTGRQAFQSAVISGAVADVIDEAPIGPFAEDDGAIPLASPTGLTVDGLAVRAAAVIGDGPHGTVEGDGRGDFDFYLVEGAEAGAVLTADIDARSIGSDLDAVIAVTDLSGAILAFNDDSPEIDSFVQLALPAAGDYVVAVAAFGSLPTNPFDSASGTGATSEGAYELTMSFDFVEDVDVYRVDLRRGDIVGVAAQGGSRVVEILDPSGEVVMGAGRDQSFFYPEASPLRVAGDATLDHVAAVAGPHYLRVSRGHAGDYEVGLRLYRPALESAPPGEHQILFVDFDGAFVDPSSFGTDSGDLSPLADFIAGWGLGPDDESALIDSILATFTENVRHDVAEAGNRQFDVEIRNSRDHADPWGEPNVTRIVIGGTREELDFDTVGLAPSVDPGNFDREETTVVLLDQASAPAGSGLTTINDFAQPDTDMVALVGRALGFVASHEAGHSLGNWHTAPNNGVTSIMDTFDLTQLGLGPDFVFGTADDVDVDFVTDELIEGFIGAEDTLARMAWAMSTPD